MHSSIQNPAPPPPNAPNNGGSHLRTVVGNRVDRHREPGDAWVDRVADEVQALLRERGLDLELLVMYDKVTEVLHAVGFSGAPARYFRSLEGDREAGGPSRSDQDRAPDTPPP